MVSGQFGRVDADDVLLRQAFSNLLRNAVEACQPAGVAPARARRRRDRPAQRGRAISVHDNGPGIDPTTRAIGSSCPFSRPRRRGTGLGLALVQKIVVTHNGRVNAGSSPSGGACFHVTLPLA